MVDTNSLVFGQNTLPAEEVAQSNTQVNQSAPPERVNSTDAAIARIRAIREKTAEARDRNANLSAFNKGAMDISFSTNAFEPSKPVVTDNSNNEADANLVNERIATRQAELDDPSKLIKTAWLESKNPVIRSQAITANGTLGALGTIVGWGRTAASTPAFAVSKTLLARIPEPVKQAYNTSLEILNKRKELAQIHGELLKQGDSPEVLAQIREIEDQAKGLVVPEYIDQLLDQVNPASRKTYRDEISEAEEYRQLGNSVRKLDAEGNPLWDNPSQWMNRTASAGLNFRSENDRELRVLKEQEEKALEAGNRVDASMAYLKQIARKTGITVDEALSNPSIISNTAFESLPYIALPKVGAGLYSMGVLQDANNSFMRVNEGKLADPMDRLTQAGGALAAGALNFIGSKSVRNALTGNVREVGKLGATAAVVGNAVRPVALEGVAEGGQSAFESGLAFGERPDPLAIGEGIALGGLSAGAMSSAPAALSTIGNVMAQNAVARQQAGAAAQGQGQGQQAAAQDLSQVADADLLVRDNPSYNPQEYMRRQANAFTTTEDDAAKTEIIDRVSSRLVESEQQVKDAQENVARVIRFKDQNEVDRVMTKVNAILNDPNSPEELIAFAESTKAKVDLALSQNEQDARKLAFNAEKQLAGEKKVARPVLNAIDAANGNPNAQEVESIISNYPTEEAQTKALNLLNDSRVQLSENSRAKLRAFTDAVTTVNKMKNSEKVNSFIFKGGTDPAGQDFFGLEQSMKQMADAVRTGNLTEQSILQTRLSKFNESHTEKSALVQQALSTVGEGMVQTVVKTESGWELGEAYTKQQYAAVEESIRKNGGLGIRQNSGKLAADIASEVAAMDQVQNYFDTIVPQGEIQEEAQDEFQELFELTNPTPNGNAPAVQRRGAKPAQSPNPSATPEPLQQDLLATPSSVAVQPDLLGTKNEVATAVTGIFDAISEGAAASMRESMTENVAQGKTERTTFRKPEAINSALANPNYNTVRNTDGSVTVIGVKQENGKWVGTAPKEAEQKPASPTATPLPEAEAGFPSREEQDAYVAARANQGYASKAAAERTMERGNLDSNYGVVEKDGKFFIEAKKPLPVAKEQKQDTISKNTIADMSDEELNNALNTTLNTDPLYKALDAEMSKRETEAAKENELMERQDVLDNEVTETDLINPKTNTLFPTKGAAELFAAKEGYTEEDYTPVKLSNGEFVLRQAVSKPVTKKTTKAISEQLGRINAKLEKEFSEVEEEFLALDKIEDMSPAQLSRYKELEEILDTLDSVADVVVDDTITRGQVKRLVNLIGQDRVDTLLELRKQYKESFNQEALNRANTTEAPTNEAPVEEDGFEGFTDAYFQSQDEMNQFEQDSIDFMNTVEETQSTIFTERTVNQADEDVPANDVDSVETDTTTVDPLDEARAKAKKAKPTIAALNVSPAKKKEILAESKRDYGNVPKNNPDGSKGIEAIRKVNLVTASFSQIKTTILALLPDAFANYFMKDLSRFAKVLGQERLSPQEESTINNFYQLEKEFVFKITKLFKERNSEYHFGDYLQYLAEDMEVTDMVDGEKVTVTKKALSDNVITAMAASAFAWLTENPTAQTKSPKQVAMMLGTPEGAVSQEILDRYATIGLSRNELTRSLGLRAYEALGLQLDQGIKAERKERLVLALGAMVYQAMASAGYLKATPINMGVYNTDRSYVKDPNNFETFANGDEYTYFAVVTEKPFIQKIANDNKGTKSVINRLFGVASRITPVSTKPIETLTQTKVDNLGTEIPSLLRERVIEMQSVPYTINEKLYQHWVNILNHDPKALYRLFGYVDLNDMKDSHDTERLIQRSINDGIIRDINNFVDSVESLDRVDGNLPEVYLPMNVWSVGRVGVASVAMNEQGSKIHRALLAPSSQYIEVDITEPLFKDDGSLTTHGYHLLALGQHVEGLGDGKTLAGKPDKISAAPFLNTLVDWLNRTKADPRLINQWKAMKAGDTSDTRLVEAFIAKADTKSMGVLALDEIQNYIEAKTKGKTTLETQIGFESDGVNNGVIISEVLYGSGSPELLSSGGVFNETNPVTRVEADGTVTVIKDVPAFKGEGNLDYYEQIAQLIQDKKSELSTEERNTLNQLEIFSKGFGSRSSVKVFAVPFNYGAGRDSMVNKMAYEVEMAIYSKIAKAFATNNQAEIDLLVVTLKNLTNSNDFNLTAKTAKSFKLSESQRNTLNARVGSTRGFLADSALQESSANLIAARNNLLTLSSMGYGLYNLLHTDALAKAEASAKDLALVPTRVDQNGKIVPIEGLPDQVKKQIVEELFEYDSRIPTALGSKSDNVWESALPTYVTSNEESLDPVGVSRHAFKRDGDAQISNQVTTRIRKKILVSRGAGMSAGLIQAIDAAISTAVSAIMGTANHHDANTTSVDNVAEMAQLQNETFYRVISEYHVGMNAMEAVLRPLRGVIAKGYTLAQIVERTSGKKKTAFDFTQLKEILARNLESDLNKLAMLKDSTYINQYGTEGGSYAVTDADRAAVDEQIEVVRKQANKILAEIESMEKALPTGKAKAPAISFDQALYNANAETALKEKAIQDSKKQNGILESIFDGDALLNVTAFMSSYMQKAYMTDSERELAKNLNLAIQQYVKSGDVKVVLINGKNRANIVSKLVERFPHWKTGAVAFTATVDGKPTIYLDTTATNSKTGAPEPITTEVILHEMMHALADAAINPKTNPEGAEAIQRLMDLMKIELRFAYPEGKNRMIDQALSDPKEFIAIAFTNPLFRGIMERTIIPKSFTGKYAPQTVFAAFIAWIKGLFSTGIVTNYGMETALDAAMRITYSALENRQTSSSGTISNYPIEQAYDAVKDYSAIEVFQGLNGNLNSEFEETLNPLMINVVDNSYAVLEQFGLVGGKSYSPNGLWIKAANEGKLPFTSELTTVGFNMSAKEQFAVESIEVMVKAALQNGFGSNAYTQLVKAYEASKAKLSTARDFHNGDWGQATPVEQDIARNKREALFGTVGLATGRNDYLARFVALGLGNQEMNTLLGFEAPKTKRVKDTDSLFDKAINFVYGVTSWVGEYTTKTLNVQNVSSKLPILVTQLVDIDNRNRDRVLSDLEERFESVNNSANDFGKKVLGKSADLLEGLANSSVGVIAGTTKTVQDVMRGDLQRTLTNIRDWRNKEHPNTALGWKAEALKEFAAPSKLQNLVAKMIRRYSVIQETRQRIIESMRKNSLGIFKENLNAETRGAVTKVLLRTGMYHLLNTYGVNGIKNMLTNSSIRNTEIKKLERQLLALPNGNIMVARAKDLGLYVTRQEGRVGLVKNTTAIAQQFGTKFYTAVASTQAVDLLNELVPLYAMRYQGNKADVLLAVNLIGSDASAVTDLLTLQQSLAEDSKKLFPDNMQSMVFGYVPEIVNPHKEIQVASSQLELDKLKAAGFKEVMRMRINEFDTGSGINGERVLMVADESTKQRYVSGALGINRAEGKGTSIFSGRINPKDMFAIRKEASDKMEQALMKKAADPNYDPLQVGSSVIPHYSNDGRVIDFAYEMHGALRDSSILERNNDFSELLASYAGSTFDRLEVKPHNQNVLKALYDDYARNYESDPSAYVVISAESNQQALQEIYATMPPDALAYAKQLWGDEIVIHNDAILATFGYSKYSLGEAFDKSANERSIPEAILVSVAQMLMGDNARIRTMKYDRIWTEIVAFIKDAVVVRNLTTLLGNIMSNVAILSAMGINPKRIVERSMFAIKHGLQYRKDVALQISLSQQLEYGLGNKTAIREQLARVNDSLQRNPVKQYIEEGLLPTIVEDLEIDNDAYSYKSKFNAKVDAYTKGIPEGIKTSVNWLMVSPSTPLYKFLSNSTQFSDFAAKFVLAEHTQNRTKDKLSWEESIELADTMFINYGVPTSKVLQGLNDRGIIMFSKYTIRIQRAMMYLLKEHPTSSIAQSLLALSMGAPTAFTPAATPSNPFTVGAFNLPNALVEPIPIKLILGM